MVKDDKVLIGKSGDEEIFLFPKMANRHGMIAGATGTGKTVTLKVLAESFSNLGVPVFLADVKGDLSGMCKAGDISSISSRVEKMGLGGFECDSFPTNYWDVYAKKGMPLRTTISEMGPLLLANIMGLNDTQADILNIVFKIADDEKLLLIDTKDLKAMLNYVGENAKQYSAMYGNIAQVSLNAIVRGVVAMESEGADQFFGEPALNISDWFSADRHGKGFIQVLECEELIQHPKMYSMFLLWLMSELYETLPEVGDAEFPKIVFFFDEAHMLFSTASKALLEKIEQVVKLIRSKGVGIYFITQNPKDIPDGVLAQLGNKIQHALHAYTPKEQEGVKAAAVSFRANPEFKTYDAIQELGTGEALVSILDLDGVPTIVKRTKICPPQSQMGPITDDERTTEMNNSMLYVRYNESFDRDSAFEFLQRRDIEIAKEAEEEALAVEEAKAQAIKDKEAAKLAEKQAKEKEKEKAKAERARKSAVGSVAKSASGTIGREIGKSVGKSVGGSFGKRLGGNVGASLGRGLIGTLFKL